MRVAWFGHVSGPRGNGIGKYSREMIESLVARGMDVLFFYHASRGTRTVHPQIRSVRIGSFGIENLAVISSRNAPKIIRTHLTHERPDIAHVSLSFSQLDSSLPEICHELGIPIVATLHLPYGPPGSFWGNAARVLYRLYVSTLDKYDAIVVFSEAQIRTLKEYGVERPRISVIPNGVDVNVFRPGQPDYKREVDAEVLVSYIGRIDPEKNVGILLEAFTSLGLPENHRLVIVGAGIDLGRLRRKYAHEPRVIFQGRISDPNEIQKIFRSSDIFVLPSAVEGLSIAMLEAMASGAAVIATDVGADGEALRGAGIVLDLESLEGQLPLALRQLIEFPEFREDLRRKARARAVELYSLQGNMDKLVALYGTLNPAPEVHRHALPNPAV